MATDVQERLYRLVVDGTQATNQLKKIAKDTQSIDDRMRKVAGAFKAVVAAFATGALVKYVTDAAQKLNSLEASLGTLRGGATAGADALEKINDIARETGASLDTTGNAFRKMAIGLEALDASNEQIAQVTESFIKLGRVGGSSMEEVNGALQQFGQALSSGKLQGDEFRSISEQMPLLMTQLAKSLNITTGELKQMGTDGKLTADVLANFFLQSAQSIDEAYAKIPETIEQGFNRIEAAAQRFARTFFNQTETGDRLVKLMGIIADEIDRAAQGSEDWKGVTDGIAATFEFLSDLVIDLMANIKAIGLSFRFLAEVGDAWSKGGIQGIKDLVAELDKAQIKIEQTARAQHALLNATAADTELLAKGFKAAAVSAELLKPPAGITGSGEAAKAAAKELKSLENAWEAMLKKVQTPDELFAELSAQLDEIVAKLHPTAEAVARVRAELEKTRAEANEKLRLESLTEYQKGWEALDDIMKEANNDAEQLRGKLDRLNQIRGVAELREQYLLLAESMGKSASAADQVAVAVAKVKEEDKTVADLKAAFEALEKSGELTAEQLKRVKEALGGLGETASNIDSIAVAVGQTLANSIGGFVDILIGSEDDINAWFGNLLIQIGKLIIQMEILRALESQKGAGGIWGWIAGAIGGSAKGNVFANGMSLKQGVYNQPQIFKFAHGAAFGRTGVMAEAGPEAVVPLKRTSSGDLGVQASPVNVVVNNYTDSEVSVAETNKEDGTKQLEILIERKVKSSLSDGSLDRSFRDNYNLSRAGR